MRLTIITINRNNAKGLNRTIESVLMQTWKDFQYVIIDGASTDSSVEVIKKFESKINYWVSEPDNGIYSAMNKGVHVAQGEYCLFLNSGDYLYSDDVLDKVFERPFHTDVHACGLISESRQNKVVKLPSKEISLVTFVASSILHPSTFMKTKLFSKYGGFDESLKIIADWKILLEWLMIHNCSYSYDDKILTVFDAETGVSSTSWHEEEEIFTNTLESYFPRIISDYNISNRTQFEYYFNLSKFLLSNEPVNRWLFPFVRILHGVFKCRNQNESLLRLRFKR